MNVENIKKVRDHIQGLAPERFEMDAWSASLGTYVTRKPTEMLHNCGTCGCIGGWTNALFGQRASESEAAATLGLTFPQTDSLFYGFRDDRHYSPADAVAVLDHLIATGEVDWTVADQVSA